MIADRKPHFWLLGMAVWMLVALISATKGQLLADYRGTVQDWWPSLGYTVAVFSVWAVLTPSVLRLSDFVIALGPRRRLLALLALLGLPTAVALHLILFVVVFWPIYGGRAPTPWAMAEPVLMANLDTFAFAYLTLLALAVIRQRQRVRQTSDSNAEPVTGSSADGLWIRDRGVARHVLYRDIVWIAAAGDYCEIHTDRQSLLSDHSLAGLTEMLPDIEFSRIHRGAIVRLDRVSEVRSLGRGDATVHLENGQTLRLSRRYRDRLGSLTRS